MDRTTSWPGRLTCAGALAIVLATLGPQGGAAPIEAGAPQFGSCGGLNDPPCLLVGCDSGLVLSRGVCVRKDALGFPTNCGDWNEPPCQIWAHIPSCKVGLVEHSGRCRKPDETFPSGCGGLNQRPCTIIEHIPSCKSTLVESYGACVARDSDGFPTNCGGNGEIACLSIPACKPGQVLDLLAGGRCLPCGEDGRPPCLDQLCKAGYRFNFNPLAPACDPMGPNAEPDCSCTVQPDTTPTGEEIHGFADLHTHPFANLGFGGLQLWGKVFDPGGIRSALPWCDYATGISAVFASGLPIIPTPFLGARVHGVGGMDAHFEAFGLQGPGHDVRGLGTFDGWPKWKTIQHQQMYYKWIERAFRGGLKLMVVHAVNNEVLCGSGPQVGGFGCNDMAAVDRQLKAAKDLEAFIDQQSGGPGTGWFRIASSGQHARQIITGGKMAVVLGIEVDNIFGCRANGTCTEADVLAQLDKYYNMGVRHVFSVHFFNNGYGAPAVYEPLLSAGNLMVTGAFYQTEDCSPTYGFKPGLIGDEPVRCSVGGLTPIGEALIRGLIRKKMIIDVDHMSSKMLGQVLDIVEEESYPVVSGHSEFLDISAGERKAERVLTSDFADRIRDLGGMFAPILGQKSTEVTLAFGDKVPNDCSHSSKSWAQAYLYAVEKMKDGPAGAARAAVGIGSDLNGGIESIGPRFGSDACFETRFPGISERRVFEVAAQIIGGRVVSYPFVAHGRAESQTFNRLRTGDRTWDINTDGVANVGLLPDFIEDLKVVGLSDQDLVPLFRSAEHYVKMWERIEARGTAPPTTEITMTPSANPPGWHNSEVSITLAATAAPGGQGVSGITYSGTGAQAIASTTVPGGLTAFPVTHEGVTELTFHARDLGGAIEPAKTASIRIDRTPPTATANVSPPEPNPAGWYTTEVVVGFTGADALSGVDGCDAPVLLSADGAGQSASGACRDAAGNQSEAARAEGINIDRTPPLLTVPSPTSFETTQASTPIAGSEALIGFLGAASATDALDPSPEIGHDAPLELGLGTTTVTFVATDRAGNSAEAETTVTMRGRPMLSWAPAEIVYGTPLGNAQLNAAAAFGGDAVTGTFDYSLPAGVVMSAGEHEMSVTFTPTDSSKYAAGALTARLIVRRAPLTVAAEDKEMILNEPLPTLTAVFRGFVNGDTPVSLDVSPSLRTTATGAAVGSFAITASGAQDRNYFISFVDGRLSVLYSTGPCLGAPGHAVLPPVAADGSSVFNGNRTIPTKFRVCDAAGRSIGASGVVARFVLARTWSGAGANVTELGPEAATIDDSFRWDASEQLWILNLRTRDLPVGTTYEYHIVLNDDSIIPVRFGLR